MRLKSLFKEEEIEKSLMLKSLKANIFIWVSPFTSTVEIKALHFILFVGKFVLLERGIFVFLSIYRYTNFQMFRWISQMKAWVFPLDDLLVEFDVLDAKYWTRNEKVCPPMREVHPLSDDILYGAKHQIFARIYLNWL